MAEPKYDILADVYRRLYEAGFYHTNSVQENDAFHGRPRIERYTMPTEDGTVEVVVTYPVRDI